MIWGHDRSMELLVNLGILIFILSIHFIRLYMKRKNIKTKMRQLKIRQENKNGMVLFINCIFANF